MSESAAAPTSTNPLAIAAVVCGGLSLPCICFCYGLPFNIAAIVLGGIAISQLNNNPEQGGKTLAQVGIGLGVLSILLVMATLVVAIAFGLSGGGVQDLLKQLQ